MPPHQTSLRSTTEAGTAGTVDVLLTALGKTWGRLVGGVLEIRRGEQVVCFDLAATARAGRPVLCRTAQEVERDEADTCSTLNG